MYLDTQTIAGLLDLFTRAFCLKYYNRDVCGVRTLLLELLMTVFEVMWGLIKQGRGDVGQFLGHPICDGLPTGDNGPEGVPDLCILGKP